MSRDAHPESQQLLASWTHATTEIPAQGLDRRRSATAEEREAIRKALGLAALERLDAHYRIHSVAGGGWRLAGTLLADVVQSCVVTLEPLPATLEEKFASEFWDDLDEPEGGEDKGILDEADVERLEGDTIPAGRVVFETLSGALDPYPRKAGARFDWEDKAAQDVGKNNPFSVLSRLKDKS